MDIQKFKNIAVNDYGFNYVNDKSIHKLLLLNTQIGIQTRLETNQDDKEIAMNTFANLFANRIEKTIKL